MIQCVYIMDLCLLPLFYDVIMLIQILDERLSAIHLCTVCAGCITWSVHQQHFRNNSVCVGFVCS